LIVGKRLLNQCGLTLLPLVGCQLNDC